ncbi:16S rRNA G966 N2-methylase RsmD [Salibacterium salarium]|uniref:hypothetical protein n=1 Tax=Salibacterium salarium TaxID=284579 RepID=UPI00278B2BFC|nr:hypothetical protein [Salibacterium salarium]MDQ0297742.1 16S rRNA G966 N2-methylase RsmD [Salibacterium salarium]
MSDHYEEEDKQCIDMLIQNFEPKIKRVLHHTPPYEREDLEQEIKLKIFEKRNLLKDIQAPGFFDYIEKHKDKKD